MNEDNDILTALTDSSSRKTFENLYINVREKEKRVYTDEQVARLPFIESSHVHAAEWRIRGRSASRLLNYLGKKTRGLVILETGCGNGWLTGKLADLSGSTVTGIDINESELNQAKRVFRSRENIHFKLGEIKNVPSDMKFDVVIFAASIQYFPSFRQTIGTAFAYLNPHGEIHIMDSPFYPDSEIVQAKQRSEEYYRSIGHSEMTRFYFHHSAQVLENYNHKILFNPFRPVNKIFRRTDPFPWICIKAS